MTYVGKILWREGSYVLTRFLTPWCDNMRKQGGQLVTNNDSIVNNLQLLIPNIGGAVSLSTWVFHALDAKYWFLLLWTLKHPSIHTLGKTPDGQVNDGEETRSDLHPPLPSPNCQAPPPQPQKCSNRLHDLPLLERQEITERQEGRKDLRCRTPLILLHHCHPRFGLLQAIIYPPPVLIQVIKIGE